MEDLQNQFGLNLKNVNSEVISDQLGLLATLQSSHGEVTAENQEFINQFIGCYDNLPEDVRKDMDETIAAMKLTGRGGEVIDSVSALCGDIMTSFDSGLVPVATAAENGINMALVKMVAEMEANGQQVPEGMRKLAEETLAQWDNLPDDAKAEPSAPVEDGDILEFAPEDSTGLFKGTAGQTAVENAEMIGQFLTRHGKPDRVRLLTALLLFQEENDLFADTQ